MHFLLLLGVLYSKYLLKFHFIVEYPSPSMLFGYKILFVYIFILLLIQYKSRGTSIVFNQRSSILFAAITLLPFLRIYLIYLRYYVTSSLPTSILYD